MRTTGLVSTEQMSAWWKRNSELLSLPVGWGVVGGSMRARIRTLVDKTDDSDRVAYRCARLECHYNNLARSWYWWDPGALHALSTHLRLAGS